ncbi:MAG TPA: trypsin-like peptidase domain-containing protein [Candidatus Saccharibacteria bacterium]|nr:trypsin-like peptidase domain-containing protein [Candidatus Saccharibacteria bacterium]
MSKDQTSPTPQTDTKIQEMKQSEQPSRSAVTLPSWEPKPRQPLSRVTFGMLVVFASLAAGTGGAAAVVHFWGDNTQIVNQQSVVMQESELVSEVAEKVSPSVVSIVTEETMTSYFGGTSTSQSAGSGVIVSKDGYIITNKHVVSSSTKDFKVIASDGTTYDDVTFVGSDPSNDIAFLKIKNVSDLTPATLGDSSTMKVGTKVVAIGNALGEYQNTVTTGIISGLSRPVTASDSTGRSVESLENLMQTDAAINPGNSGGPLVNLSGEIIGINTAVASDAEGIGFAIPINDVKGMIKTLLAEGKVVKPYIGVRYVSITPEVAKQYDLDAKNGAYVVSGGSDPAVVAGSPAEKAGLKEKDIITKVNGTTVDGTHPFASLIAQHSVGEKVTLTYVRDGKEATVTVTLAERSS